MARKIVTYKDFGGEAGLLAYNTSAKSPRNLFHAENFLVASDKILAVRPGLRDITPSGLSNGLVHGFGNSPVPFNDLWFIQGTAVRTFSSAGDNLKTSGTALAETPSQPVDWRMDGATILIASASDKLYRITPQTGVTVPTVAALTGSPGAKCIEVYGDRIVAGWIDGSNAYRLRYSDVADPNSWPSANFVDVGDTFGLNGLFAQRQHLLIAKQNSMHVLTGSLGSSQALRKVYTGAGPMGPLQAKMGQRDLLWYQDIFAGYPSTFNGSLASELAHLKYSSVDPNGAGGLSFPPSHGVVPITVTGGGATYVDENSKIALFLNGAWTYHSVDVNTSGYVASNGTSVYFCDGGGASATPKFYKWDLALPAVGSVTYAGDGSTDPVEAWVEFPEWWTEDGSEVMVRAVVVDFVTYNTGSATNNHFDLVVSALRRYQGDSLQNSTTVSYDAATAAGTHRRVFGFGEQGMGGGFQLYMDDCVGIGIVSIQVVIETEPLRV